MAFANFTLIITWLLEISLLIPFIMYAVFLYLCTSVMLVHLTEHLERNQINPLGVIVYTPLILVLIGALLFFLAIEVYYFYYNLIILTDWVFSLGLFTLDATILAIIGLFRIGTSMDVNEFNAEFETGPKFFSGMIIMAFGGIILIVSFVDFTSFYTALNPVLFPDLPEAVFTPINALISALLNLIIGLVLLIPSWRFVRKESKKRRNWQKTHWKRFK